MPNVIARASARFLLLPLLVLSLVAGQSGLPAGQVAAQGKPQPGESKLPASAPAKPAAPTGFADNSRTFSNPGGILFFDGSTTESDIAVAGLAGPVLKVAVTLNGLSHSAPADVDVLLVGPQGQNAIIMSDAGLNDGSHPANNLTITLDDSAAAPLPDSAGLSSGTFQPTNYGAGDSFSGAPAPVGGSALAVFDGSDANGTWRLYVADDRSGSFSPGGADSPAGAGGGSISGGWSLAITIGTSFANPEEIDIFDYGSAPLIGTPYPSPIEVTGLSGTVLKVTVTLHGFGHIRPADVDLMLVGPQGQNAIIMSDAGADNLVTGLTITLDDGAAAPLPQDTAFSSGTFRPANYFEEGADYFAAPAPAPAGGSALSVFNGTNPNGTWRLYSMDDRNDEGGAISGGWSLLITAGGDYANANAISIRDNSTAAPYPSNIVISGLQGAVRRVGVTLHGFSHAAADNVDILLVGPGGQTAIIMSDAGPSGGASNLTLTLDDVAAAPLPAKSALNSGTFQATNYDTADTFPGLPQADGSRLGVFYGSDPNGTWRLYVLDDQPGGSGAIAGGWSLAISTGNDFWNPNQIDVNDSASPPTIATTYPSSVSVSGLNGTLTKVTVTLYSFSHTYATDVDVLLVGPDGDRATIMSDAGPNGPVDKLTLTLDDGAANSLPGPGEISSGSYRPTDNDAEGADSFPAPAPAEAGSALAVFDGANPNGTWSLYVVDDAEGDSGAIYGGWSLTITTAQSYSNTNPITINDSASPPTKASPYPSSILVSGLSGTVQKVAVTLRKFSHSYPEDVDILLVGPGGQNAIVMSDAGFGNPAADLTITLDDSAAVPLPDQDALSSGAFQPANYPPDDSFPAPAPAPSGGSALSVFNGTNPNGTWRLFVVDANTQDSGMIAGGWVLRFTLAPLPATATRTPANTRTSTVTRTNTPTRTRTATRTSSATRTSTVTRTRTATRTSTRTFTRTSTPTRTRTPTRTVTFTRTRTITKTPTVTRTPSVTRTSTRTPTRTRTNTRTSTATRTSTLTRTRTTTRTATNTPVTAAAYNVTR